MGVERNLLTGGKTGLRRVSCRIDHFPSGTCSIERGEAQQNPNVVIVKQRATMRAANRYYASS